MNARLRDLLTWCCCYAYRWSDMAHLIGKRQAAGEALWTAREVAESCCAEADRAVEALREVRP